jgi:small subunit ribosomal protein S1
MSWTKRISHPNERVQLWDQVKVMVLDVNMDKQEISLGMKQTEDNPWEKAAEQYPPGTHIKGKVRNLTSYGAFVEIEEGIDGLLHVSDMSWTKKISNPAEVLKKGDEVEAVILSVDPEKKRIALGLKQLQTDPWEIDIPERYRLGVVAEGVATKHANFGVFVELEEGLEGLLHISELPPGADPAVEIPAGERIKVRVLKIDPRDRKIGLTLVGDGTVEEGAESAAAAPASEEAPAAAANENVEVDTGD